MRLFLFVLSVFVIIAICRGAFGLGFWPTQGFLTLWTIVLFAIESAGGEG